ncbi:hypothetical protein ACIBI9_31795 [Nonomuraea sp. NPDC050451]|uniref:hypothetical protein n=1 Tax=Nonomuraea sp. NPDC050451 TaxID=3364364 RepID=UPI00378D9D71
MTARSPLSISEELIQPYSRSARDWPTIAGITVTEAVYRHQLKPLVKGAQTMNSVFGDKLGLPATVTRWWWPSHCWRFFV